MRLGPTLLAASVIVSGVAGEDGSFTVAAPNQVLNGYAALASDAPAGTTTLVVTTASLLDTPPTLGPLDRGDLVLVMQMQGAVIDTSDSAAFGSIASLGGAGSWEIVEVVSVTGSTIEVTANCGGLRNSYGAAARTQVVRVPRFLDLTITGAGSLVAPPWDGEKGGIIAVHVATSAVVDGTIDATASGFRGGAVEQNSAPSAQDVTIYRSALPADGAEKGESIAGDVATYDSQGGRYGRGAPANGGGGGDSHNAGGGGGANGANGNTWNGQGVMDGGAIGAAAWALDPATIANGNQVTASSGGGRGGYTFSANAADALTQGPGDPAWGGNQRRERGGLGGRPLDNDPSQRLFLGGGGGAGDSNNGAGGAGGRGGGIVLLIADSVLGTGTLSANGGGGVNTTPNFNDGPGGGGGGGTIVIGANTVDVAMSAAGGGGGNQPITNDEAEGPGGGGGGGYIAISAGSPTRVANGGTYGISSSQAVDEFPANGATGGAAGVDDATFLVDDLPICFGATYGVEGSGCACAISAESAKPSLLALALALIVIGRRR